MQSTLSTKDLLRDGSFAPDVAGVYEMLSVSEVANNGECRRRERQVWSSPPPAPLQVYFIDFASDGSDGRAARSQTPRV